MTLFRMINNNYHNYTVILTELNRRKYIKQNQNVCALFSLFGFKFNLYVHIILWSHFVIGDAFARLRTPHSLQFGALNCLNVYFINGSES